MGNRITRYEEKSDDDEEEEEEEEDMERELEREWRYNRKQELPVLSVTPTRFHSSTNTHCTTTTAASTTTGHVADALSDAQDALVQQLRDSTAALQNSSKNAC